MAQYGKAASGKKEMRAVVASWRVPAWLESRGKS